MSAWTRSVARRAAAAGVSTQCLSLDNINPLLMQLEYAIRGPVTLRSYAIQEELKQGVAKPFGCITAANIGDPQYMGQPPLTFFRQVMAAVLDPSLCNTAGYPKDVVERAKELLSHLNGNSAGAYTFSLGVEHIRRRCADYIARRDGVPADWQGVWLTAGSSAGLKNLLKLFVNQIDGKPSGVMIPIPQYPLYSATLTEYGLDQVFYYLDENMDWSLDIAELERALAEAGNTCVVRAIVVINPGNPTGQVLSRKNIEDVIKFAHKHNLFIIADEVYQDNVYAEGSKFYSFKKVLTELGPAYSRVQLASFMSASKGYAGECGARGGYMELTNMERGVLDKFYVLVACGCPPVTGQVAIDLVARPPQPGEDSYEKFAEEKRSILDSLKERAEMTTKTFNQMEGFTCNVVQGAMYAFPRLALSAAAEERSGRVGLAPDVYYACQLLERTGICIVPGTGFGQKPGTYHFRTTILPSRERLQLMLDSFQNFHKQFTAEHA